MFEFQTVWGWQPALYLFLGGMGAGALLFSAVLAFIDGKRHRLTIGVSLWSAAACMTVGLLLLLSELTNPVRGMLAWQSFVNPTSWMTYGAWGVLAAIVAAVFFAICMTPGTSALISGVWKGFSAKRDVLCRVFAVLGGLLGLFVAVYTGLLLMSAPGIPFWGSWLLPLLFTVSALDTGVALVEIVSVVLAGREIMTEKCTVVLERSVLVLVIVETVVLTAFLATMAAGGGYAPESASGMAAAASSGAVFAGSLAPFFWCLVVACGLAAPLTASVLSARMRGKDVGVLVFAGASGALIGGCALRFLVLMAGAHANMVADTVAMLVM